MPESETSRQLLRHTVATFAYRGGNALRDSPQHFGSFHIGDKTRTPAQILAHMGDLFDWALSIAQGKPAWHDSGPLHWNKEVERSSPPPRNLTITWLPPSRFMLPRKVSSRARSPTP